MTELTRKIVFFLMVMAAIGAGGWFGRKALKASTERRLIAQARASLEKKDWKNAALCLRRALQIRPNSVGATRLMADALEEANPQAALSWRIRLAEIEPGNVTNRLQWAETALKAKDVASAAQALTAIAASDRNSAWFHKLSGYLAYNLRNPAEAEKEYREALRIEPANAAVQLNLCMVQLASTNRAVLEQARASLEQLATNPAVRFAALHDLTAEAVARTNLTRATGLAREIVKEPGASFADKLDYLQLLEATKSTEFGSYLSELKKAATNSVLAFGLARWMLVAEGPTNALRWIQSLPSGLTTNQPLPLIAADCHIAMKDWAGLLGIVQHRDWQEADSYRAALEALALRSQHQATLSEFSWKKAVRAASGVAALARLAQVTAAWGWAAENKEILQELVSRYPKEKWAGDQLMARLYQDGNTSGLASLVAKMAEEYPKDLRLKNNLANIYLLRRVELEKAHRLAREAYVNATNDPFIACTFAYSLVLQNKSDEALEVVDKIDPRFLKISSVAAYYGVVQAYAGHKNEAREPLMRADAANLLPEEKEMVRLAKSRL